jgi:transcriptional regulator with XRE-family HTH domain
MDKKDDKIVLYELGAKLLALRTARKLSQRQLADLADMTHTQIQKLETGQLDVQVTTLVKLLLALEVQPNDLLPTLQ